MHQLFFEYLLPDTLLFSRFKLLRCLNASDFYGIYLCQDTLESNKRIVIKLANRQTSPGNVELETFLEEMVLGQNIRHENVLTGYEFFVDEDFMAFSMEYMPGGTLADLISSNVALPIESVLTLMTQVCSGVQSIHTIGFVHRDLKPENILLDRSGQVKIADFGIATQISKNNLNRSAGLIGSVNYLSPEYIKSGYFDKCSDVYALGRILYELLTAKLPFSGVNVVDTLTRRVLNEPEPPSKWRTEISAELDTVVIKALQRESKNRFQTCDEMLEALKDIQIRWKERSQQVFRSLSSNNETQEVRPNQRIAA